MAASDHLGAQFTDLWHTTDHESAASIQREGLHPSPDHEAEWGGSDGLTVAHDRETAHEMVEGPQDRVVHLRVPTKEWHEKYQKDYEDWGRSGASSLHETIPPKYVHRVEKP